MSRVATGRKRGTNDRGTEHAATDPSAPTGTPGHVAGRDPRMVNAASNRQLIGEALAQLPAEQLAVVRRSYYQAWTTAQIADDLHIAEDTVKSRLHYALQALLLTLQGNGLTR